MDPKKALEYQKQLTLKQQRFLEEYIKLGNATEAAMIVYDCNNRVTAGAIGYENLKKLQIDDMMEAMGITDKTLLQSLALGIRNPQRKVEAKTLKYFDNEKKQEVTETVYMDVPDYQTRHKYVETALRLKKRLTNGEQNTTQIGQMNFVWGNAPTTPEPTQVIDVTLEPTK